MSSQPNISDSSQMPENPPKSMKGKYDGRGKYDRKTAAGGKRLKTGPKPLWLKNLSRTSSCKVIEKFDAIATAEDIYRVAWANKLLTLCVQMREDAQNRAFGRPYQAINPAEQKVGATVNNDNRLQNAIINLIPGAPAKPKKKAKLLVAESEVVSTDDSAKPEAS